MDWRALSVQSPEVYFDWSVVSPGLCVTWVENHNCRSIVEAIGKDVYCLRTDFGAQALKR